jgi:hypothetical protein
MKKILILFTGLFFSCSKSDDMGTDHKVKYQVQQDGKTDNVKGEIRRFNNGCIAYDYDCGCLTNAVKSVTVCGTYKIIEQK